jgi:hypothetical protein
MFVLFRTFGGSSGAHVAGFANTAAGRGTSSSGKLWTPERVLILPALSYLSYLSYLPALPALPAPPALPAVPAHAMIQLNLLTIATQLTLYHVVQLYMLY